MTSLDEKAQASPDVDLARQSAPGLYRLETDELVSADELTPKGEFPQYGDFLEVSRPAGTGEDARWREEVHYVECPQGLAAWLVEEEVGVGDPFRIQTVQKVDGNWEYGCEVPSDLPTGLD